ncbi:MAG TPA: hypothetical protein VIH61_09510 [Waddliaceae bacterium]
MKKKVVKKGSIGSIKVEEKAATHKRVQTAEGWKQTLMRRRAAMKKTK